MLHLLQKVFSNKKIIFDIVLNISAAALPVAILQLFIYPQLAKIIGGHEFGLMLTVYSIWFMLPNSLGNVLNNIKLLRFQEYQENKVEGDFPVLLRFSAYVGAVLVFVSIWLYYGSFSVIHVFLGTVIGCLILLKAYLEVWFRIELNYSYVLLNNIILSLGFLVGYILFCHTYIWEFIFLFGYLFCCVYCIVKTPLLHEPCRKTILYHAVKTDFFNLIIASVIGNLTSYADKLILYPLMGGLAVSVYYTASILGKITSMLTGPINGVVLSYITRWDKGKANIFSKVLAIGLIISIFGYLVALFLARPILGLLFPQWLEPVMEIIPLTTFTVMLGVLSTILQPFVLKYCNLRWQTVISAIGSIIYFSSALLFWKFAGLKGFCIGTIIGVFVKLLMMIIIYYRSLKDFNC